MLGFIFTELRKKRIAQARRSSRSLAQTSIHLYSSIDVLSLFALFIFTELPNLPELHKKRIAQARRCSRSLAQTSIHFYSLIDQP